ncbi:hypothetical protein ABH931_000168 [Streptacidiphilus sp. MAP12-33]
MADSLLPPPADATPRQIADDYLDAMVGRG